jgi:hypothetical protein
MPFHIACCNYNTTEKIVFIWFCNKGCRALTEMHTLFQFIRLTCPFLWVVFYWVVFSSPKHTQYNYQMTC